MFNNYETIEVTQQRLDATFEKVSKQLRTFQDLETKVRTKLENAVINERSFILRNDPTYSPDLRQETIQQLATRRQTFQKASARLRKKIDDLAGTELLILQEFATLETRVELQVAMNASKLRADNITAMLLQQKEEQEEQEETKAQQQKQWKQSVERRVAADRSDETCSICLVPNSERSPFWIDENVTLYPGCGHMYHSECLNDWVIRKKEVSRSVFNYRDMMVLFLQDYSRYILCLSCFIFLLFLFSATKYLHVQCVEQN